MASRSLHFRAAAVLILPLACSESPHGDRARVLDGGDGDVRVSRDAGSKEASIDAPAPRVSDDAASDASAVQADAADAASEGSAPRPDAADAGDAAEAGAASMWNGVDLSEWDGDPAVWRVEGDAIVGSAPNGAVTTNTFLVYRARNFGDFVMTADIWLDAPGNSGIQFRSAIFAGNPHRLTGYQADVGGGYWGSLYEELGRGTLVPASSACLALAGFGKWLSYEVRAQGPSIELRISGTTCAAYQEQDVARPKAGILGLQYHVPGGYAVRFRNLRIREL
jgi:hypothetical protein